MQSFSTKKFHRVRFQFCFKTGLEEGVLVDGAGALRLEKRVEWQQLRQVQLQTQTDTNFGQAKIYELQCGHSNNIGQEVDHDGWIQMVTKTLYLLICLIPVQLVHFLVPRQSW